jgi:hypothetical protein
VPCDLDSGSNQKAARDICEPAKRGSHIIRTVRFQVSL